MKWKEIPMQSKMLRVFVLVLLLPVFFRLFTLVVALPVMLYNVATGIEPVTQSYPIAGMVQLIVGLVGGVWASAKVWKKMGKGD